MGQIQWTSSLIVIGLFAIAIISFASNFATDNSSAINIADDSDISGLSTALKSNVSKYNVDSQKSTASIINSSISSGGVTTQSAGSFSITPTSSVKVASNILRVGYTKIFGSGNGFGVFITSFLGLIVFIVGMMIWKTWAGRNPE